MSLDTEEERIKFVKIYDTYRNRMHYTANMILKDELNAEDMVHDTFLTLTDYLDRINEEDPVGTWQLYHRMDFPVQYPSCPHHLPCLIQDHIQIQEKYQVKKHGKNLLYNHKN